MLSQPSVYAISALGHIATLGGQPALVKDVAEECGIPSAFLAKILHGLVRKGLLVSRRGIGGGMSLARDPAQLTLFDVCEAMGDAVVAPRCLLGMAECSKNRACPAHDFCTPYREKLLGFLRGKTIADIAEFETKRKRQPKSSG